MVKKAKGGFYLLLELFKMSQTAVAPCEKANMTPA